MTSVVTEDLVCFKSSILSQESTQRTSKMVQQVEMLAAKPKHQSSVTGA